MSGLHEIIGKRAYELLPEWEQSFWLPELKELPRYCAYPDTHLEAQWEHPELLPFYEHYCLMPDGSCIPHGPGDAEGRSAAFGGETDFSKIGKILHYYFTRIVEELRKNDVVESARFAGTLAHFLQDCSVPVHSMDNILINRLFPDSGKHCFFYHRLGDSWPFLPEKIQHEPLLLGRNIEEAVFCATEKIGKIIDENIGRMVPFVLAVQQGNKAEADRVSQGFNTLAVTLTADVWHTLFSIASGKIPENAPAFRHLTDSCMVVDYSNKYNRQQYIDAGIPFYPTIYPDTDCCRAKLSTDPYPYEPVPDHALNAQGDYIPLELIINGKRRSAERGVAAGTYGIATYRVPGSLFSELEVYAGIHPDSATDKAASFAVWCPEATPQVLVKGSVSKRDEALRFTVQIPENCREISLLSAGDGAMSAIWLEPRLKYRTPNSKDLKK